MPPEKLRLHLTIRRHDLNPAHIWWSVDPTDNLTITDLLSRVNDIIPLESPTGWGLEDYLVSLDGGELLHFQRVNDILQAGDRLEIRPLRTDEVRARRSSGRAQVAENGMRLLDGVAFGRAWRGRAAAYRPDVLIPPKKRVRLTYGDGYGPGDDDEDEGAAQLLIGAPMEQDDYDDDGEDDGDYAPASDEHEDGDGSESGSEAGSAAADDERDNDVSARAEPGEATRNSLKRRRESGDIDSASPPPKRRVSALAKRVTASKSISRRVTFVSEPAVQETESSRPGRAVPAASAAVPDEETAATEQASSDAADRESLASEEGSSDSDDDYEDSAAPQGSESEDSDESESHDDSGSDDSNSENSDSDEEYLQLPTALNQGSGGNESTASEDDGSDSDSDGAPEESSSKKAPASSKSKSPGPAVTGAATSTDSTTDDTSDDSSFGSSSDLSSDSSSSDSDSDSDADDEPSLLSSRPAPVTAPATVVTKKQPTPKASVPSFVVTESNNQTVPPNQEAPNAGRDLTKTQMRNRRRRLAKQAQKGPASTEGPSAQSGADGDDDNDWSSRFVYGATECAGGDPNLPPPPFPFVKTWHNHGRVRSDAGPNGAGRKPVSRTEHGSSNRPDPDDPRQEETSILHYDDDVVAANDPPTPKDDDLPSLPSDLSQLRPLKLGEAVPGTVITWREISLSTLFQPIILNLTASVVSTDSNGSMLSVLLAKRDRNSKQDRVYDPKSGRRVYSGLEAPDSDDDDDGSAEVDDGYRTVAFGDLDEPRIVRGPLVEEDVVAYNDGGYGGFDNGVGDAGAVDDAAVVDDADAVHGDDAVDADSADAVVGPHTATEVTATALPSEGLEEPSYTQRSPHLTMSTTPLTATWTVNKKTRRRT